VAPSENEDPNPAEEIGESIGVPELLDETDNFEAEGRISLSSILFDGSRISQGISDAYERHFGQMPIPLSETSKAAVDRRSWKSSRVKCGKLGSTVDSVPEGSETSVKYTPREMDVSVFADSESWSSSLLQILERLKTPFQSRQTQLPRGT
jgi:hypothetical protein